MPDGQELCLFRGGPSSPPVWCVWPTVLFARPALIAVAEVAALPVVPLLLVVIPLPKLLGQLAKALL